MTVEYDIVKPHIGAVVHVDRQTLSDPDFVKECLNLLDERIVLVFPEANLSDAEQLAFTDLLGERVNFVKQAPGGTAAEPDVYKITLDPKINDRPEYVLGTFFWHMDGVTADIPPPKATLLSARRISAKGGQTEFANLFAAYEFLPAEEKADLEGLKVVHSVYSSVRPVLDFDIRPQDWKGIHYVKEHPLVWSHSDGRKSLLVGSHAESVVGMTLPEGRALLARLLEWAAQPDFTYRHKWSEGDFVVWNNCGSLHRVIPYDKTSGRTMHRTSIAGTEAIR